MQTGGLVFLRSIPPCDMYSRVSVATSNLEGFEGPTVNPDHPEYKPSYRWVQLVPIGLIIIANGAT